ncbi:NPCBM/NEW2 domain-containing protein [Saccharibacillus alkalitolerans]|uniref:Glycosyl hydrolase family 98 putative carbohydrate-binding module domain-containing protein n=1 Tax=Saccharibacillus alkalitolerans TaxID=2705290 RepID=A0ABX0F9T3_9BACL|nr:NPCBM/NEW2 domain-containing protein [Saccharibacillus alkalitolerans]NGZ76789.1 hypothetical protein [Saccharibacillus alkalitolerans]
MSLLKKMKYGVTGFTLGAVFFGGIAFGATSKIEVSLDPVKFIVNNVDKTPAGGKFNNNGTSVPASLSYNGTVYVPLKMVGGMVDKKVGWDAKSKSVLIGNSAAERVYLTDLAPSKTDHMSTNDGITIGGQEYKKALSTGSGSQSYKLKGEYKTLTFGFGASDRASSGMSYEISVYGDGQKLWSGLAAAGVPLSDASVSVGGVSELEVKINGNIFYSAGVVDPVLSR